MRMPEIDISLTQQWLAIIQIRNGYIINISKKTKIFKLLFILEQLTEGTCKTESYVQNSRKLERSFRIIL